MKKTKVWIAMRKGYTCLNGGCYDLSPLSRRPKQEEGCYIQRGKAGVIHTVGLCAADFEPLFPHLKMKPGDKPRRVEITMEFCD